MACDICDVWFNYKCVGIPREEEINNDDGWLCSTCEKLDTTSKLYPNSNIRLPVHYKWLP